jgi:hypothetical protein
VLATPAGVPKYRNISGLDCTTAPDRPIDPKREFARLSNPIVDELRAVARDVRNIGRGRCRSPESWMIDKQEAAERLFDLARRLELVA